MVEEPPEEPVRETVQPQDATPSDADTSKSIEPIDATAADTKQAPEQDPLPPTIEDASEQKKTSEADEGQIVPDLPTASPVEEGSDRSREEAEPIILSEESPEQPASIEAAAGDHQSNAPTDSEQAPAAADGEQGEKDAQFVDEIEEYMRRIQLLEQMIIDNKTDISTISNLLTLDNHAVHPHCEEATLETAYWHTPLVYSHRIDESESFVNHKYQSAASARRHKLLPSSSVVHIGSAKKRGVGGQEAQEAQERQSTSSPGAIDQYEDRVVHVVYLDHMQLLAVMLDDRSMVCLDATTGKSLSRVSMIEHCLSPITSSLSVRPSLMLLASRDALICVDPSDRWSVTSSHRAPVVCEQDFDRLSLVRDKHVLWVCASDCFLLFALTPSAVILAHKFCPQILPFDHLAHLSASSVLAVGSRILEVDVVHSTVLAVESDASIDGLAAYYDRYATFQLSPASVVLTSYVGRRRESRSSIERQGGGQVHMRYLSFSSLLLAVDESLMIISLGQHIEVAATLPHPPVLASTAYSHIHSSIYLLDPRRHIRRLVYYI